jgi:leucine-zipper of insertion element IS481
VSDRNARTTFHGRPLMVRRYQAGWAKAHIAKAMGVSRKCPHWRTFRGKLNVISSSVSAGEGAVYPNPRR